jgi:hypothetical protein
MLRYLVLKLSFEIEVFEDLSLCKHHYLFADPSYLNVDSYNSEYIKI